MTTKHQKRHEGSRQDFHARNFLYAEMVDLARNGLEMKLTGYEVAKAKSSNENACFSPSVFGVSSTRVTPCLCT